MEKKIIKSKKQPATKPKTTYYNKPRAGIEYVASIINDYTQIGRVKLIQDSNKSYIHIIAYKKVGFVFDGPLFEISKDIYFGFWDHIDLYLRRFFIIHVKGNQLKLHMYKDFKINTDNAKTFVKEELKRGL